MNRDVIIGVIGTSRPWTEWARAQSMWTHDSFKGGKRFECDTVTYIHVGCTEDSRGIEFDAFIRLQDAYKVEVGDDFRLRAA